MKKKKNQFAEFQFDKSVEIIFDSKTSVQEIVYRFPKKSMIKRFFEYLFKDSIVKFRAKQLKKSFDYINKRIDEQFSNNNINEIVKKFNIELDKKMNKKALSLKEFNKIKDEKEQPV